MMDANREPLTCTDLIARALANEAHCCELCHDPAFTAGDYPGPQAYRLMTSTGEIEVELCCSQALTVNAHEYLGRANA